MHTCGSDGKWGACTGEVTPYNGSPDVNHPCNGTNFWCDPNGVKPAHCPQCITTDAPASCGNANTCNAGATEACTAQGTRGACTPAPAGTCQVGTTAACSTCNGSSAPEFSQGTHACTTSCNYTGAACVANGSKTKTWGATDSSVDHYCGGNGGNGMWGTSGATSCSCLFQHGPGLNLPKGSYTWTVSGIQFASAFTDNTIWLNVTNNVGAPGISEGSPQTFQATTPNTSSLSVNFTVTEDCNTPIYLEIIWNCSASNRQGSFYYTTNTLTLH
jgi:hypothetical protein